MDCNAVDRQAAAFGEDAPAWEATSAPSRPGDASLCMTCPVRSLCIGGLAAQAGTRQLLTVLAGRCLLRAGETVHQPCFSLSVIRRGSLKSTAPDGDADRPHGFHFPGEVVGAGGLAGSGQALQLVALEDTELCAMRPGVALVPGIGSRAYTGRLWDMISRDLVRERAQAGWLASLAPERRVAAFLASLALRVRAAGSPSRRQRLHMSAADIAGFLELPLAAVERELEASGADARWRETRPTGKASDS
jgi:CRP/FNR family transcriptional regulator